MIRQRLMIEGLVQGVGFRFYAYQLAQTFQISGFIQNQADGRVLCECQGEPEHVAHFIERLSQYRFANIQSIQTQTISCQPSSSFHYL